MSVEGSKLVGVRSDSRQKKFDHSAYVAAESSWEIIINNKEN